jgi:hypothetical protein
MAAGQVPDDEYTGPAYAERCNPAASLTAWCRGEALVWAARAGAGPERVRRLFGPPLLQSQFRGGPVEW